MRSLHVIVVIALILAGSPGTAASEILRHELPVPAAEIHYSEEGVAVKIAGFGDEALPGRPRLPVKTVRLALPPDVDASSVEIEVTCPVSKTIRLEGAVRPMPPLRSLGTGRPAYAAKGRRIVEGRDVAVYRKGSVYPRGWSQPFRVGHMRDLVFVEVPIVGARYGAGEDVLVLAETLEVRVQFERIGAEPSAAVLPKSFAPLAARLFEGGDLAAQGYRFDPPGATAIRYGIVTTEELFKESLLLGYLVELREEQGYPGAVYTEEHWDHPTGDDLHDTRADRIRSWLSRNYDRIGLEYVLLVGNPDPERGSAHSIPMKPCGKSSHGEVAPTDFYYSDLSEGWDANRDGIMCDLMDGDSPDFVPELFVGRIPVYSDGGAAVDEIISSIATYEQTSDHGPVDWRRRALLPMSIYFFEDQYGDTNQSRWDGASVGEWLIRDVLSPRGRVWTSLYERDGIGASRFDSHLPLTSENVVDQWHRGYGFVFWAGHGAPDSVYRLIWDEDDGNVIPDYSELRTPAFMSHWYTHMFEGVPKAFVVHGSCSNGTPESPDNLAYSLLRSGSVAALAASREAMTWHFPDPETETWEKPEIWSGDVIDIAADYSVAVLSGMEASRALAGAIATTGTHMVNDSIYQKSIQNLYGDPLMRLVMCRKDADCDNRVFCDGAEVCVDGVCEAGNPDVVCGPTLYCDSMICDEERGCLPGPGCVEDDQKDEDTADVPTDEDTDTNSNRSGDPLGVTATGGSSCRVNPPGCSKRSSTLLGPLFEAFRIFS